MSSPIAQFEDAIIATGIRLLTGAQPTLMLEQARDVTIGALSAFRAGQKEPRTLAQFETFISGVAFGLGVGR